MTMSNRVMTALLLVLMALLMGIIFAGGALIHYANAQESPQQVFRDASGRTIGTAARSGNQTIFRDSRGATTGSATTDRTGNTVFRDSRGSTIGTSSNAPHARAADF